MLIGIDASRANRLHKSGTEWYAFHLIKALAKLDNVNQYVLYTDQLLTNDLVNLDSNQLTEQITEPKFDKAGFQIISSPHNNFKAKVLHWPLRFFWTLGRLSLEMIFKAPEVLFVPSHTLPLIHPKRAYVTIHDIGFKRQSNLYDSDKLGYKNSFIRTVVRLVTGGRHGSNHLDYLDWSTKFALKHAKQIITISNFSKQELQDVYQAKEQQIKVVHNGYNQELYQPKLDPDKLKLVLSSYGIETPYLFYVGRLEKKKNTSNLIHALAILKQEHPDIKHKLVLSGTASFGFDEIKYSISEFGLDHDVIITGWIKEMDMPYIFKGADCFVFPTNYEGFGIPLLEAMGTMTAIAASDILPVREVVGEAALLFNPDDVSDIASKLYQLLSSPELRRHYSHLGLERVKNYNWDKCAQETLAIITQK